MSSIRNRPGRTVSSVLKAAWAMPRRFGFFTEINNNSHWPSLHRHGLSLLSRRRRAGAAHAHPARLSRQQFPECRHLQSVLHDARHRDDVPVCGSDRRSVRRAAAAEHARRARHALPQTLILRVLVLRHRRRARFLQSVLQNCAGRRLVHVPAAHRPAIIRPGSIRMSGC